MRARFLCLLLAAVAIRLAAQSQCQPAGLYVNTEALSTGTAGFESISSVKADTGFNVSGSASVTFIAGSAICLGPGFQATAGSAQTTFVAEIAPALQFTTPSTLPGGSVGGPYYYTFTASGGVPPYSYGWCSYPILGLTLSSTGTLSGSPGALYNYTTIGVAVTDSVGFTLCGQFSLDISYGGSRA